MLKSHYRDVAKNQDKHWWYLGMLEINKSLLDKYLLQKTKLKILDAGCGPGAMLPMLSEYGEVLGIDLSDEALKYARKRGKVIKGDVTKLPFKGATFDLVVCMDVLYHMWVKDEEVALREFNRILKPDGLLLLREPAYDWLRGREDIGSLTKRRFQVGDLSGKLKSLEFRMLKVSYVNFFLFPIVLLVRLLTAMKPKSEKGTSDLSLPSQTVNTFLFDILKFEASLLKFISLPFGSSLVCIAQKV